MPEFFFISFFLINLCITSFAITLKTKQASILLDISSNFLGKLSIFTSLCFIFLFFLFLRIGGGTLELFQSQLFINAEILLLKFFIFFLTGLLLISINGPVQTS
jgi:hypothetical protein